jgi:hypothetical protein
MPQAQRRAPNNGDAPRDDAGKIQNIISIKGYERRAGLMLTLSPPP